MPHPKTLGASIDKLFKARGARLALERKAGEMRKGEQELHEHILGLLAAGRLDKASGKLATAAVQTKPVAKVADWPAFLRWVVSEECEDAVQRRVNAPAVLEHVSGGAKPPKGIEIETLRQLSLVKR